MISLYRYAWSWVGQAAGNKMQAVVEGFVVGNHCHTGRWRTLKTANEFCMCQCYMLNGTRIVLPHGFDDWVLLIN
jgi:hypothetical protein